jgi:hypothetical protein
MRKWFVPLTMLSIGGIGALILSETGRRGLEWLFERMEEAPDRIADWNESAQSELEKIQASLNELAETLQAHPVR